ncbi:hypothetical protein HDU97_009489 [Phlyctochytrium planicorne]|nr:hypothetical protein HDU97_009489 [Phlyctochytrium planicorne]
MQDGGGAFARNLASFVRTNAWVSTSQPRITLPGIQAKPLKATQAASAGGEELDNRKGILEYATAIGSLDAYLEQVNAVKGSTAGSGDVLGIMAATSSAFSLGQSTTQQLAATRWTALTLSNFLCTFDVSQLNLLQDLFENSPAVRAHLSGNKEELERITGALTAAATASEEKKAPDANQQGGGYLGFLWSAAPALATNTGKREFTLEEDLLDVVRFFGKLSALRVSPLSDKRFMKLPESKLQKSCSLSPFINLSALEIAQALVSSISDWSAFGPRLLVLKIHEGLVETDASDLAMCVALQKFNNSDKRLVTHVPILSHLSLSYNGLIGLISTLVQALASVEYLDLSHNSFKAIPPELTSLKGLKVLNLAHNKITDLFLSGSNGGAFSSLQILSLRKNSVEILSGIDRFPVLKAIDLAENNIAEVYESGRLAEVATIDEVFLSNNPFAKTESYRLNVLNYFKERAINLLLDGVLPSSTERKQIRAGLTIAAVVSTAALSKVSTSRSHLKGKSQSVELGAATSSEVPRKKKKKAVDPEKRRTSKSATSLNEDPSLLVSDADLKRSESAEISEVIQESRATTTDMAAAETPDTTEIPLVRDAFEENKSGSAEEAAVEQRSVPIAEEIAKVEPTEASIGSQFMSDLIPAISQDTVAAALANEGNTAAIDVSNLDNGHDELAATPIVAFSPGISLLSHSLADQPLSPTRIRYNLEDITPSGEPALEFMTPKSTLSFESVVVPSMPLLPAAATLSDQIDSGITSEVTTPSPQSTPPKTSSPWSRIASSVNSRGRLGRLAELQEKRSAPSSQPSGGALSDSDSGDQIDSEDLLMSRSGKKGVRIKSMSRKQSVNVSSSPSGFSPRTSSGLLASLSAADSDSDAGFENDVHENEVSKEARSEIAKPVLLSPETERSPPQRARSPLTVENLRRENGQSWFKMYEELKEQEKNARTAASAAQAAAAAATEAARLASEAARLAEQGFRPPPLPNEADGIDVPSIRRPLSPGVGNSPPRAGFLNAIGPYRKVYDYKSPTTAPASTLSISSSQAIRDQTQSGKINRGFDSEPRSIHVTFATSTSSMANTSSRPIRVTSQRKVSTSGPDVERGSFKDIKNLQLGSTSQPGPFDSLPPMTINPIGTAGQPQNIPKRTEIEAPPPDTNVHGVVSPSASSAVSPQLLLSRPITTNTSYRRPKSGDSVSSRSDSISTFSYIRPMSSSYNNRSLISRAASIFSGEGGGGAGSVFSGLSSLSRPNYSGNARDRQDLIEIPRAPSIPFRSINNSLQLHLKFRIFPDDTEKILVWVPGSFVIQEKPYVTEPNFGVALNPLDLLTVSGAKSMLKLGKSILSDVDLGASMAAGNVIRKSVHRGGVLPIDHAGPVERAAYFLLTDRALCIFIPTFSMPYDPRSTPFENGPVVLPHMADVAAQVRYDDPRRVLRLHKRIPLERLARVDVGPNRQYIAVHFVGDGRQRELSGSSPVTPGSGDGADPVGRSLSVSSKASTERLNDMDGQASGNSGPVQRPTIESLVLLTRDRTITSKIIDSLVTTLYDAGDQEGDAEQNSKVIIPGASGNTTVVLSRRRFKGADGRVRLVNQDVEWSLRGLRDLVLMRSGPKQVFWNYMKVDPLRDWKAAWTNGFDERNDEMLSTKKKGWLGGLLDSFSTSSKLLPDGDRDTVSDVSEVSNPSQRRRSSVASAAPMPLITEIDNDPAASDDVVLDKVNFEFLRLYQLVGWIVPHEEAGLTIPKSSASPITPSVPGPSSNSQIPPLAPETENSPPVKVTVHSLTLSATTDYIYLASERFDIWPPPLFPPEYHPSGNVNDSILSALAQTPEAKSNNGANITPRMSGVSRSGALMVAGPSDTSYLSSSASSSAAAATDPRGIGGVDPDDYLKGLAADRVPQWSPPLRVGRVKDLIRCERWRTWRWTLNDNVSQVREATIPEREVAMLIQNGAIGTLAVRGYQGASASSKVPDRATSRRLSETSISPQEGQPSAPPTGERRSGRRSRTSSSGFSFGRTSSVGSTAGWEWWVRVVFAAPSEESLSGNQGSDAPPREFWWDLVFSTLDGANEFLEYVRDVRGVKPEDGDALPQQLSSSLGSGPRAFPDVDGEDDDGFGGDDGDEDLASAGSVGSASRKDEGSFVALAAGSRDMRLKGRVRSDGVAFLIGDD